MEPPPINAYKNFAKRFYQPLIASIREEDDEIESNFGFQTI